MALTPAVVVDMNIGEMRRWSYPSGTCWSLDGGRHAGARHAATRPPNSPPIDAPKLGPASASGRGMPRRIRWFPATVRYYEVVIKCVGDEMLMRPDPRTVFLIAQALASACNRHPTVGVVGFCFVSNHGHLLLRVDDDGRRVSGFMKTLDERIAMDLNRHRGRDGHFFKGRPKITPVLDEANVYRRLAYIHAQPVHHDLVERVEDWPGLSSFRAVCEGKDHLEVTYFDETGWRSAGSEPPGLVGHTARVSIPLVTLHGWMELNENERHAARCAHELSVRARQREKAAERGHRRLGKPSRHTKIDPYARPVGSMKRGPQPWAHGSEEALWSYRQAYSVVLAAYRVASAKFRNDHRPCDFPPGTFPPWAHSVSEAT